MSYRFKLCRISRKQFSCFDLVKICDILFSEFRENISDLHHVNVLTCFEENNGYILLIGKNTSTFI